MGAKGPTFPLLGLSRAGPTANLAATTSGSASRLDVVLQAGLDRLGNLSLCETEVKRDRDDLKGDLEKQSEAPEEPSFKRERSNGYFELTFFQGADPLVVETVFGLQVLSILGRVDAKLAITVATILMEINKKETDGGPTQPLEPASTGAPPVLDPSLENVNLLNLALEKTISRWGRLASGSAVITSGTALSIAWFLQPTVYATMPSALINGIASSGALATLFTPQTAVLVLSLMTAASPVLLPLTVEGSVIALKRAVNHFIYWKAAQPEELLKLYNYQQPGYKENTPNLPLLVPIRNHYLCTLKSNLPANNDALRKYTGLQNAVLGSHALLGRDWFDAWDSLQKLFTSNPPIIRREGASAKWNQSDTGPSNFTQVTNPPLAFMKNLLNSDKRRKQRESANANAMALINSCTNFHTILMWLYVLVMDRPNLRYLKVDENGDAEGDVITYKPPIALEPIPLYSKRLFTTVPPSVEVINRVQRISAKANIDQTLRQNVEDAKTRKTTATDALETAKQTLAAAEPMLVAAEEALAAAEEALASAEVADAVADDPDEEAAGAVEEAAQQRSDAFTSAETAKQVVDNAKQQVTVAKQMVDTAEQTLTTTTNEMENAIKETINTFGVYDNPDPNNGRCTYIPRPNGMSAPTNFKNSLNQNYLWWTDETAQ